ncbi:chemotaxis protein [Vibrio maerlii]|uniref:chemotaxis protein n=1 Tax=Vibrio maerlii TaxID=2231648 RepID=UPI001F1361DD|nr:chemotaxis protein [Vibrio maerlii]
MRLLTREYTQQFFSQVEQSADHISEQYDAQDRVHQSYVLLWKINAQEGMQQAAYQVSPMAALIDAWVFTEQMNQYFDSGAGADLFDGDSVQGTSSLLAQDIEGLAKGLLKQSDFETTKSFVSQFAQDNPFLELSFIRTPAYRAWLEANQISEDQVVSTLGTMPEALGDVSDRLSLVSEQTPKLMTWKAQLIALNSTVSGEQLNKTLESLQATSRSFQDFVENNPEYMEELARQMNAQLAPLVEQIDSRTESRIEQLSEERQALEKMVARERAEIAQIISKERAKFTQDIDQMSQDVVALAIDKLIELIKSTIIYFILFIVAIFFAPLGLGYMLGKRSASKVKAS